jgi:hypothetical protein
MVHGPDGCSVQFTYDAFARRMSKRLVGGDGVTLQWTQYVWDGDDLIHETSAGGPTAKERTYVYLPRSRQPLWHCDARLEGTTRTEARPVYYLCEGNCRPEVLINGDGVVLARPRRGLWGTLTPSPGAAATTSLRFAGHHADEETGITTRPKSPRVPRNGFGFERMAELAEPCMDGWHLGHDGTPVDSSPREPLAWPVAAGERVDAAAVAASCAPCSQACARWPSTLGCAAEAAQAHGPGCPA